MDKSENIDKLAQALSAFQASLEQPKMNSTVKVATRTGGSYTFKYADFSDCKEVAKKPLADNGLAVSQLLEGDYTVRTVLMHSSGQWISGVLRIPASGNGAQDIGSAITYAKRYSFCAILGIVADDDEDGNLAMGNTASKRGAAPKQPGAADKKKPFDAANATNEAFFQWLDGMRRKAEEDKKPFGAKSYIESLYQIDQKTLEQVIVNYTDWRNRK